tara:strand:+ start:1632 stop:2168 length:537 start_codon:yes stop_codon:yes gene_type:complete
MTDDQINTTIDTHSNPLVFKRLRLIYALLAFGAAACFISYGIIFLAGLLAVTVGIIMAYFERKRQESPLYHSHARWQIRTFWIGNLIVFPVAMIAHFILIYMFTDFDTMVTSAYSGQYGMSVSQIEADILAFQEANLIEMIAIKWATYGLALIWWTKRLYDGYRLLKKPAAVPLPVKD